MCFIFQSVSNGSVNATVYIDYIKNHPHIPNDVKPFLDAQLDDCVARSVSIKSEFLYLFLRNISSILILTPYLF